jgi:hypothetical protein
MESQQYRLPTKILSSSNNRISPFFKPDLRIKGILGKK